MKHRYSLQRSTVTIRLIAREAAILRGLSQVRREVYSSLCVSVVYPISLVYEGAACHTSLTVNWSLI